MSVQFGLARTVVWLAVLWSALSSMTQAEVVENPRSSATSTASKQISVHVRLVEINRTKLRRLGFDFAIQKNEGIRKFETAEKFNKSIGDGNPSNGWMLPVMGFFDALCQNGLARTLTNPTIVMLEDSNSTLRSGTGKAIPGSGEVASEEFVGTELNLKSRLLEEDKIELQIRLKHSAVAELPEGVDSTHPIYQCREVDTGCEIRLGETLMLAAGPIMKSSNMNGGDELELVLLVTPDRVASVARHNPRQSQVK